MKARQRQEQVLRLLNIAETPLSGNTLAKELSVSRQIIIKDISLLREKGYEIISTYQGYLMPHKESFTRIFKVIHSDDDVEKELNLIVDLGGRVEDVFIYHKVYNIVRGEMRIRSRKDVLEYLEKIQSGSSSLLKNVTSGYHYHTVQADSEKILDIIHQELEKEGFLAKLQDYEPVDFQ